MAKKIYYDDIIISEVVQGSETETVPGRIWVKNRVVDMVENVEIKEARKIVEVLKRVLSPKYHVAQIGPGQYKVGSVYSSKL